MNPARRGAAAYGKLISAFVIMGTVGLLRRWIPVSSALLAVARGLIGGAAMGAFVLLRGSAKLRRIPAKKLAALVLTGALIGLNWMLLFEAIRHTTVAAATLCYYIEPTLVLLASPLLFRERLTAKKLACAAAALLGMVFVSGVFTAGGLPGQGTRGILFGLAAGAVYASVVLLNKKLTGVDAYEKTAVQLLAAAAALTPYLLATEGVSAVRLTPGAAWMLLLAGVVHTGVAYWLYFSGMEGLPAQTVSMLSYLDPVVALLASVLILREPMTWQSAVGAALILVSALVSETGDNKISEKKRRKT